MSEENKQIVLRSRKASYTVVVKELYVEDYQEIANEFKSMKTKKVKVKAVSKKGSKELEAQVEQLSWSELIEKHAPKLFEVVEPNRPFNYEFVKMFKPSQLKKLLNLAKEENKDFLLILDSLEIQKSLINEWKQKIKQSFQAPTG